MQSIWEAKLKVSPGATGILSQDIAIDSAGDYCLIVEVNINFFFLINQILIVRSNMNATKWMGIILALPFEI